MHVSRYSYRMPYVQCKKCAKEFYAKPSHLKLGWSRCCSTACRAALQKKGRYVACEICGNEVWRSPKDLRKSKSNTFFCGKSCQSKWRNVEFSGKRHLLWRGGAAVYRQLLLRQDEKPECKQCGISDIRILVAHHIDQDRKNNTLDNLMWLCHNCHHLVHNHNEEV